MFILIGILILFFIFGFDYFFNYLYYRHFIKKSIPSICNTCFCTTGGFESLDFVLLGCCLKNNFTDKQILNVFMVACDYTVEYCGKYLDCDEED